MAYVLAIDAGTTGVRAHVFDESSAVLGAAYEEISAVFPRPGWMEQDPLEVWRRTQSVCAKALAAARVRPADIRAIGICNQRATFLLWDRSGRPLTAILVWQDVRAAVRVPELLAQGVFTNAMASAAKVDWLFRSRPELAQGAFRGEVLFGTIDTWLVWNLSGGQAHVTDPSNASCTTLYDAIQGCWDSHALKVLDIPEGMLPEIVSSSQLVGHTTHESFGAEVPIAGLAGDQQAAMFGEVGFDKGAVKVTFGTSAMVDIHTGEFPILSRRGAYPLVLWGLAGRRSYCLEGTVVSTGGAVQWLRDGLGILGSLEESGPMAESVADSGGVWAIPALQGLGTPHMDPKARGVIGGLSRGSTRAHIVRAVLEAIAYRTREVLDSLLEEAAMPAPERLRVDGGAAANDFLLRQLSDVLGLAVERPQSVQASALGAAYLAGLAVGVWKDIDQLRRSWRSGRIFEPRWGQDRRDTCFRAWQQAIESARLGALPG